MNRREMGEILAVFQAQFAIHPDSCIDFATEAGDLHSARVLNAIEKTGLEASKKTMKLLAENIEKTPPTGSKLVDAFIEKIHKASEGVVADPPLPPRGVPAPAYACDRTISKSELDAITTQLERMGVDPHAPIEIQRKQFREWVLGMNVKLGREMAQGAKPPPPRPAPSREQAEKALADVRKPRKPNPPPQLNPEALALAVFANGDERSEREWIQ